MTGVQGFEKTIHILASYFDVKKTVKDMRSRVYGQTENTRKESLIFI